MKKNKKSNGPNKAVFIILTLALVVVIGLIFTGGSSEKGGVEIKDGIQYIRIDAKGGYTPQITEAKSGIPTKLIVKTNGTYDCSASLVIRSVGYQEILPETGETEIDLGIKKPGEKTQGVCGMGMYSFEINFS